tara:strand:- start:2948 stop:3211 length:264 start_codon:yes stop_codon:yes gene_type:complete
MGYGQAKNTVKVKRVGYPKKLERKAGLSAMILRSFKGGRDLSSAQIQQLKKHSVHHTNSHMKQMIVQMVGGDSFEKAHKKAQKKIGK